MTPETLLSYKKEELAGAAARLNGEDIEALVALLGEKNDDIRYNAFLLLQHRATLYNDVYPYWDVFENKLKSENSYQRSLGLMLLAENARWDTEGRFDALIETYLTFCDDKKPVTVRQCIQSLCKAVPYKPQLYPAIIEKLTLIDLGRRKETQRKILLMDIISVLLEIQKRQKYESIESYLCTAMTGALLDKKTKSEIQALLNSGGKPCQN